MQKIHLIIILFLSFFNSIYSQKVIFDSIDKIKLFSSEMPSGFFLYQERLVIPSKSSNEQIMQLWKMESNKQSLILIEETQLKSITHLGASSFQKWYRDNQIGKKEKIEMDIIICESDSMLNNTITHFTQEEFDSQFQLTEVPIIGEKTWIQKSPNLYSYSIMFSKSNVFVRVYVGINDKNIDEIKKVAELVSKNIEKKIAL